MGRAVTKSLLLILLTAAVFLSGWALYLSTTTKTSEEKFPAEKTIDFETIDKGGMSGFSQKEHKKQYIVKREQEWQEVWDIAHANVLPKPTLPEVDFETYIVLAVFQGNFPTGGYDVSVEKILVEESVLVNTRETSPAVNCIVTQALTAPYQIIKIPKTEKEIVFTRQEEQRSCKS